MIDSKRDHQTCRKKWIWCKKGPTGCAHYRNHRVNRPLIIWLTQHWILDHNHILSRLTSVIQGPPGNPTWLYGSTTQVRSPWPGSISGRTPYYDVTLEFRSFHLATRLLVRPQLRSFGPNRERKKNYTRENKLEILFYPSVPPVYILLVIRVMKILTNY